MLREVDGVVEQTTFNPKHAALLKPPSSTRFDNSSTILGQSFVSSGSAGTSARLNIFDGTLGPISVGASDGVVNVLGGQTDTLFGINGIINVTDGSPRAFNLTRSSTAHWTGGELWGRTSLLRDDATLHIYGRGLTYDADGSDHLTGRLLDDTNVEGYEIHSVENSRVILHNVPEPQSLELAVAAVAAVLVCGGAVRRG